MDGVKIDEYRKDVAEAWKMAIKKVLDSLNEQKNPLESKTQVIDLIKPSIRKTENI